MAKKVMADPLSRIPSAKAVREKLNETQATARQLQILLDVAERLESERSPLREAAPCR